VSAGENVRYILHENKVRAKPVDHLAKGPEKRAASIRTRHGLSMGREPLAGRTAYEDHLVEFSALDGLDELVE
jgi:hypothetical protein